jgi:hypothetical protein
MRTTTALATTALLLLGATACSSTPEAHAPTVTKTVTATPALSKAETTDKCIEAVYRQLQVTQSEEPRPAECKTLDSSEWLDALFKGNQKYNKANRDALGGLIDDAATAGSQ